MIDFDVESTGVQPWSQKQHAFMYQFFDPDFDNSDYLSILPADDIRRVFYVPEEGLTAEALYPDRDAGRIQMWLDRGAELGIRAHNRKFDQAFGFVGGFDMPGDGCWHDSMVSAQAINERRSVALKMLSDELLGEGSSDLQKEVKKWLSDERARRKKEAIENGTELIEPDYSDVPPHLMVPYGLEDVYLQRRLSRQFDLVLSQQPSLAGVVEFERRVGDALFHVERRGLSADFEGYNKLRLEVMENLERLEDLPGEIARQGDPEIYAKLTGGKNLEDFNVKSTPQILAALRACGADMSYMATEDGEIRSADKENLEAVDHPLVDAILQFRGEYKVLTTYVTPMVQRHYDTSLRAWMEPFVGPDEKIHANYRQVGARTGRMSCSGPNMQNQPRDDLRLRYNIKAPPGFKLVSVDLSNIEMRIFAAYAGPGRLLDAVRRGDDLHTMTAKFIGINDRMRAGGYIETARQRGKVFNFSVIYGGGLRTIRRQQRVDQAGARRMRQRYYAAYPEVERLQNKITWRLEDQGYIEDMWGRRYRCTNPRKEAYKFVNYLIQGSACQILKDALVALHADGVPVVGLIHDEILACVPEEDAEEAKALITKRLTEAAQPGGKLWVNGSAIVPLDAEGDIVDRWSDCKPLKDENGRPYLFTPKWAGGEKRYVR